MRTDNRCIAGLVSFTLRTERAFSLRHPSFEAQGIPLTLSWGGTFERREAKAAAGVLPLAHVNAESGVML